MPYTRLIKNLTRNFQFTEAELGMILNCVKMKRLTKRMLFCKSGDVCRQLGFVNKGLLKTYFTDHEETKHNIQLSPEDFWICDMTSYVTGKASITSVEVLEDAEILYFEYEDMEELYKKIPKFETHFRMMLQNRMVTLYKDRFNLISLSAEQRYLDFLNSNPELVQRISQKDIASYLGIFPESLSRIRKHIANK
jgi:CRP-like cAMP-binding protein